MGDFRVKPENLPLFFTITSQGAFFSNSAYSPVLSSGSLLQFHSVLWHEYCELLVAVQASYVRSALKRSRPHLFRRALLPVRIHPMHRAFHVKDRNAQVCSLSPQNGLCR